MVPLCHAAAQPVLTRQPFQTPNRPQKAARDKAAYESSFGPFYRVEQLILTTTPDAPSPFVAPDGRPAVVTDANIRLLFDMQAEVDAISGRWLSQRNLLILFWTAPGQG